jgi:hypothetical protein
MQKLSELQNALSLSFKCSPGEVSYYIFQKNRFCSDSDEFAVGMGEIAFCFTKSKSPQPQHR